MNIGLRNPGKRKSSVKRKLNDERKPSKYQRELFSESTLVFSIAAECIPRLTLGQIYSRP